MLKVQTEKYFFEGNSKLKIVVMTKRFSFLWPLIWLHSGPSVLFPDIDIPFSWHFYMIEEATSWTSPFILNWLVLTFISLHSLSTRCLNSYSRVSEKVLFRFIRRKEGEFLNKIVFEIFQWKFFTLQAYKYYTPYLKIRII